MRELTLRLSRDEAVRVLNALAAQPYRDVAELIARITQQVNGQGETDNQSSGRDG